ncbi:MAG: ATP-binding protein [Flavobacteriaceae bacterium]|nr:ATP-binding protein [Flavobacteriaceae bacterium]MCY4266543.1 ATP-binding protein [Flavobacteriaceae bacterium]
MDRGKAIYFHGRHRERQAFRQCLDDAIREKKGTSFLVQGPPGVGKTALVYQLMDEHPDWHFAKINPTALYDLNELRDVLGLDKWWQVWKKETLSVKPFYQEIGFETNIQLNHHSFEKTWQEVQQPTVLFLDEAQRLQDELQESDRRKIIRDVLSHLHNLETDHGFCFLVAGLNQTKSLLNDFHISRFAKQTVFRLKPLDRNDEEALCLDWLVREGGVKEATSELKHWVDTIMRQTQGWPQHVTSYGEEAARVIRQAMGKLTDEGLKAILKQGQLLKNAYYEERVESFSRKERQQIAEWIQQHPVFDREGFMEAYSENLFDQCLSKGVFDQQSDGAYQVPIPSMMTWLMDGYGESFQQEQG